MIIILDIVLVSTLNFVSAQEIGVNQTDSQPVAAVSPDENEEISLSSPAEDNTQDKLSSTYLELDNDADKENIYIGDEVTWIITVENFGPEISKNTKVIDKLPDGLKYVKHSLTKGIFNPNTGIWNIGDLKVEEGIQTLLITTKAITTGEKINEANLTSDTDNINKEESFEEEEIDVFERDDKDRDDEGLDKEKTVLEVYETGYPIFLIMMALFAIFIPVFNRQYLNI